MKRRKGEKNGKERGVKIEGKGKGTKGRGKEKWPKSQSTTVILGPSSWRRKRRENY